ncbi:ABC transporter permease [Mycetocola miduiensis]|uniref:NitT/TauT family transport system permease protein n=1 Tax=Mycetocola miduiensis TaxID=995034 RepID=A0A1I5AFR1_9MICO|nr:ABC transporter permease [Mycetocola miduiensis]SFN61039.1 NitT/TauT family transport system permease protein [Mycetocola miduiensis]
MSTIELEKPITATAQVGAAMVALSDLPRRAPRVRSRQLFPSEPKGWLVATLAAGIVIALFAAWQLLADADVVDTFFWSKPSMVWESAVIAFSNGTMLGDTLFTFTSTIAGFVLGVVGGAVIGLSFWWSRLYARTSEPLLIAVEAMPKLALAPMIVLALGIGIESKIAMATALVIIIQVLNTHTAVRAVDRDLQTLLYSLGASRWQVFTKVVVPSTISSIVASFRVSIGLALTGAIVGEYIGSQEGLGKMIQFAASSFDISLIWVGVFTLGILSFVLYLAVLLLEKLLLRAIRG